MDKLRMFFYQFKNKYKWTFLLCMMVGLLSHGSIFFYKYTWHDDSASLFHVPEWGIGRWLMSFLGKVIAKCTSGFNYSLPFLYGVVSIVLISVFCCMCVYLLEISNKYLCVGLCLIFAACPVVTATFAYMFNAPYYFLALLFAVIGSILATSHKKISWLLSSICFCNVAALYPAYICVFLSLMLLWLLAEVYRKEMDWRSFFLFGFRFAGLSVCGLLIYALGNIFFLWYTNSELTNYQGIGNLADVGISTYISGIRNAYVFFVMPARRIPYANYRTSFLYSMGIEKLYSFILFVAVVLTVVMLWKSYKKNIRKAVQVAILVALLPAVCNFIFIMCPSQETMIHTLMVYGEMFLFVFVAWCLEFVIGNTDVKCLKLFKHIGIISLMVLGMMFLYFDNIIYLKMQLQYEQYKSEMTMLTSCIRLQAGYRDDMAVAFLFTDEHDATVPVYPEFSETDLIIPYTADFMYPAHNEYTLLSFLKNVCGFAPPVADKAQFIGLEEVSQMPAYPDSGSIRIIMDTVVVKL